ncbi:MAG: PAS domain S-box protein [Candidatus Omnitrophica bacterium]|nr:PAS domain S-box protein [Candidatus Omnitrophota bacterium]
MSEQCEILPFFIQRLKNVHDGFQIYQALAECFQNLADNLSVICLEIDQKTFEVIPVRDSDRALMNTITNCIESGICAEIMEEGKVVLVTDQESFHIKETDYILLFPLFNGEVQSGIIFVVFPKESKPLLVTVENELNILSLFASKLFTLFNTLVSEKESVSKKSKTQNLLSDIVENVIHGLIALDKNNIITIFNKNAEILFGLSAPKVIGRSYRDVFPEKVVRAFDLLIEDTMIAGSILDYEIEIALTPSIKIPVGLSSSILYDNKGEQQGVVCVCRDRTLMKEVNRLKDLDNLKSEFVSTVSHELKNPIAVIKSTVELLLAARRLGKQLKVDFENQSLVAINEEIDRLSQLINDLLNLSRLEAQRVEVKKELTNVKNLFVSAAQLFHVHEKTHPIQIIVENIDQKILLDADKIKQVLINYIGNAIKYSPGGSPIEVKATIENRTLRVTVSDHGIGIPEDKLPNIFVKFTRISTPETQAIGGTGLGLSICKKIMDLHHGHVWCESTYHEGSIFGFAVPFSVHMKKQETQKA